MSAEASPLRSEHAGALAPGTRLHEFELQRILGIGGFGIVYQAFDHALEREVAIKEYMPANLAGRTETVRVSLLTGSDPESFRLGRESFVKEAKLLARFDHPSLLKVYRYWEANGTAYMAMPVLRGRTLKQLRQAQQGPTDEAWLRKLLMPLLGAIETLHRENVFHRDIAPDNIQVEPDGHPVLMDFGAARRVLMDTTQSITAILKPAYAPIEQYGEAGAVKQGPWTDLYALGATLHYMLLGRPPAPATARTVDDEEMLLTTAHLPQCSQGFLLALQWMLRPRPADRPQSVAQLREVLEGRAAVPAHSGLAEMRTQRYERPDGERPSDAAVDLDLAGRPTPAAGAADLPTPPSPERPAGGAFARLPTDPGLPSALRSPDGDVTVRVPPPAARAEGLGAPLAAAALPAARRSPWPWVMAGLAAVGAAAALFWPKTEPATAAASPAANPSPTLGAPLPVQPPGTGAATATPGSAGAVPESPTPTAAVPSDGPPVTTAVPPAANQPPATSPAAAAPTKAPAPGSALAAEPRAASSGPPRAEGSAPAPRPAARQPVRSAAEPVPAGPGPACGARSDGVRYLVCMERECASEAFSGHPACAAIRQ